MTFVYIAVELLSGLILLFIMTKILGKTQISQITPFEFISALVLGELVGNAVYDREVGLGQVMFAVTFWVLLLYIIETVEMKSLKMRGVLEGVPSIIIRHGILDKQELKKNRLSINQLQNMMRQKDVFSVREIEYGILESNGTLTVMKKPDYEPPTRKDVQVPTQMKSLPVTLISDGTVLKDNLTASGRDENWLAKEIREQGYKQPEDIFLAEWDETQGLFIVAQPQPS